MIATSKSQKGRIQLDLDNETAERLKSLAADSRLSRTALIRDFLFASHRLLDAKDLRVAVWTPEGRTTAQVQPMPKVFLSYSRRDIAAASKMEKALKKRGIEIWLDEKRITVGQPILDAVRNGLQEADFLIVLLSDNSLGSEWCKVELRLGYDREMELKRPFVLPVLVTACEIPPELKIKKYVSLTQGFRKTLAEIATAIRAGHY